MFVTVIGVRLPHVTKAQKVISKLPIMAEGKKAFIYCQSPIGDGETVYDNFTIGQTVCADRDEGGFFKLSEDQTAAQGQASQAETVKQAFNGSYVREPKITPEDIQKRSNGDSLFQDSARLLTNCINHMNASLDGNRFSGEDCRTAGISLFIFLSK